MTTVRGGWWNQQQTAHILMTRTDVQAGTGGGLWGNMVLISPQGAWCHILLREAGSEEKGETRWERVKQREDSEGGLVAQSCSRLSSAIQSSEGRGSSRLEYLSCSRSPTSLRAPSAWQKNRTILWIWIQNETICTDQNNVTISRQLKKEQHSRFHRLNSKERFFLTEVISEATRLDHTRAFKH